MNYSLVIHHINAINYVSQAAKNNNENVSGGSKGGEWLPTFFSTLIYAFASTIIPLVNVFET